MSENVTSNQTLTHCNCCGSQDWEYRFTESNLDLGRCKQCGLHYVRQMSTISQRLLEMESGVFANNMQHVVNAIRYEQSDKYRADKFEFYVKTASQHAPVGKWLDIGCGTGLLMKIAQKKGCKIEGIELTPTRREIARKLTGATIYDKPLEQLKIRAKSISVVIMINVFSHLTDPTQTFTEINRVLKKNGILLLYTSEIDGNIQKKHNFDWALGDHLYLLGKHTIEVFAEKTGFEIVSRKREWAPSVDYSAEYFRARGRSGLRNLIKSIIVNTPGALPLLRWYMLNWRCVDNPLFNSTLVLRKT